MVRSIWMSVVVGLVYSGAAKLGLLVAVPPGDVTAIWPASGVALAAILVLGYRVWPGISLAAFFIHVSMLLNDTSHVSAATSIITALSLSAGEVSEALLGAVLLKRSGGFGPPPDHPGDVVRLATLAGLVSCGLNATIGITSLALAGFLPWSAYGISWRTWWIAHLAGMLVVTPLLLSWRALPRHGARKPARQAEAVLLWTLFAVVSVFVFEMGWPARIELYPGTYFIIPFLIWAALRFGPRSVTMILATLMGLATWATAHGRGPLAGPNISQSLWSLQAFVAVIPLTVLVLAAAIHQRNTALETLHREQAFLRTILENLAEGIVACDTNGVLTLFNAATRTFHGLPALAIPPDLWAGFYNLYLPDGTTPMPKAEIPLFRALQGERVRDVELMIVPKQGQARTVLASGDALFDAAGQKQGAVVVMYDITARKRAEEALRASEAELRASEAELRALFAAMTDVILVLDAQGRYIRIAPTSPELLYKPSQELLGKTLHEVFPPAEADSFLSHIRRALETHQPVNTEYRLLIGARETWFAGMVVPIQDDRVLYIARDITERKRAEEGLVQLAAIVEASDDAIVSKSLDGRIRSWNPGAERLYGYAAEEVVGRSFAMLVLPDHADEVAYILERIRRGEPLINYETVRLRKDGTRIALSITESPIKDASGQLIGISTIARDITERKRVEAALADERAMLARRVEERTTELRMANAELARSARLKDEFLASMSHELRTPLNAVLGLSEALQEQVYGPLTERQLAALHNIEESGRHLLALINDILDLSKIAAGKLELAAGPVAVTSVCEASLRLLRQQAQQKGLTVVTSYDPRVSVIQADERRLMQVLVNLLSNAVKFTPSGGELGLEVAGDALQQVVHFSVWDTGIGIAQADLPRLFQPFVQLDSSLARTYAGTGLGLALVRRMVELHGGTVAVESTLGTGSRFTVTLPWTLPAVDVPRPASLLRREAPALGGHGAPRPVILLAEDDATTALILTDYLHARGYIIVVAQSGDEAIERAREVHPVMILMDIQMPGLDGLETMRRMQADADLAPIPIIALTASAMEGDRQRCLMAGADDYLSKPVRMQELAASIERLLLEKER